MNLIKVSFLSILASSCSGSVESDYQDLLLLNDFDVKINNEIRYYKTNPIKAKKGFSSVLSQLGCRKSLENVRNATAQQINSKSKVKDAIARRVIKMVKKIQNKILDLPFDSDLSEKLKSSMIKVCSSLLILQLLTAALENPAIEAKLKREIMDDSSVLSEIYSPEQRIIILGLLTSDPEPSLGRRALIEIDEYTQKWAMIDLKIMEVMVFMNLNNSVIWG